MENIIHKNYRNTGNINVLKYLTIPGHVLDIGCGGGDNASVLRSKNFSVDGITISESELLEASQWLRKGYLFNVEEGLPQEIKNKKYDYVICSHVLEHICYPKQLLLDIKKCLKEEGILIVALPNLLHYKSRMQLIKGNFNYQSTGIWDNTHFKWYTFKTGANLLEENGFKIVTKTVTGRMPGTKPLSKLFSEKTIAKLYNQLTKISPGFFGYQLLYVASIR